MTDKILNLRDLMDSLVFGVSHTNANAISLPVFMANYLFEIFTMFATVYLLVEVLYLAYTTFTQGKKQAIVHFAQIVLSIFFILFIMSLKDTTVQYRGSYGYAIISWYSKIFKMGEDIADSLTYQVLYSTEKVKFSKDGKIPKKPDTSTPLAGIAENNFFVGTKNLNGTLSLIKIIDLREQIAKQKKLLIKGELELYKVPEYDKVLDATYKIAKGLNIIQLPYKQGYTYENIIKEDKRGIKLQYHLLDNFGLTSKSNFINDKSVFADKFNILDILKLSSWQPFGGKNTNYSNVVGFSSHKYKIQDYIFLNAAKDTIDGYIFFMKDIVNKLNKFKSNYKQKNNINDKSTKVVLKDFDNNLAYIQTIIDDLEIVKSNLMNFTTKEFKKNNSNHTLVSLKNLNDLVISNNKNILKLKKKYSKNINDDKFKVLVNKLNEVVLKYQEIIRGVNKFVNEGVNYIVIYNFKKQTGLYDSAIKRAALYDMGFINVAIRTGTVATYKDPTYNLLKVLNLRLKSYYKDALNLKTNVNDILREKNVIEKAIYNFIRTAGNKNNMTLDSLLKTIYNYEPAYARHKPNNEQGYITKTVWDGYKYQKDFITGTKSIAGSKYKEVTKANPKAFYEKREISWVDLGYYFAAIKAYMSNYIVLSQYYLAVEQYLVTNKLTDAQIAANLKLIQDAIQYSQQYRTNAIATKASTDIAAFKSIMMFANAAVTGITKTLANPSFLSFGVLAAKGLFMAGFSAVAFAFIFLIVNLIVKGILIIVPAVFWFVSVINWYISVAIMIILIPIGLYSLLLGGRQGVFRDMTKKTVKLMLTPTMLVILFFIAVMFSIEIGIVMDYFIPYLSQDAILQEMKGINAQLLNNGDSGIKSVIESFGGEAVDFTLNSDFIKTIILEAMYFIKLIILLFFNIKLFMLFSKATEYIDEITEVGNFHRPIDAMGDASGLLQKFKMNV